MRNAVAQIFAGNLISKILGLGREIVLAALFGTGQAIGAYRVAQTGTLVPVNFFTSDSLNAAFIPLYIRFKSEARDKAQTLFWSLFVVFSVLSLLLTVGLWWLASIWVAVLAPGLESSIATLASRMLQIMGIGVPFYLVGALVMFLSMGNDDYVPVSARASIQNLGLIAGAVIAFTTHNATFFAWGFTGAYIVFCFWTIARAIRAGYFALPSSPAWPGIGEIMHAFWETIRPLLFLPVLLQGNIAVERAVATLISLTAVSALNYARFVSETVIFLIAVPVAFTGLSSWSGLNAEALRRKMHQVLSLMLLVAVPISAFLAIHAKLVVMALYARAAFDARSVNTTTDILFGISIGLWAQAIGYVFIKGLNTQLRNRTVMLVMAVSLAANAALNLALYPYLGALTLGLGNSAYSLVLLVGTLTALRLWRSALPNILAITLGAGGYLVLNIWIPVPENKWAALGAAGAFALLYWTSWIAMIPNLRLAAIEAITLTWRR